MGNGNRYKAKCVELEEIVEECLKALSFIPIEELRREVTWYPSDQALRAIERAKDLASAYAEDHWNGR